MDLEQVRKQLLELAMLLDDTDEEIDNMSDAEWKVLQQNIQYVNTQLDHLHGELLESKFKQTKSSYAWKPQ